MIGEHNIVMMTAEQSPVILQVKEERNMITLPLYLQASSRAVATLQEPHGSLQNKALVKRVLSFLTGGSRSLLDLKTEVSKRRILSQHDVGSQTVAIRRIKGSEGRSSDFDCDFNPLHARTRDRWMSIAMARARGDRMPLVELIQLDEEYFVRDGHHRISVARAFGEEYIDARVIVLK